MSIEGIFDEFLLREIRERFMYVDSDPFSGRRIYFENAGGTLKLKTVLEVIETFSALPDNAGRSNPASRKIDGAIAQGRRDIALFVGAGSGHIIAEQSTTGMLFRLLDTIHRNTKGSNVVVSNLNHASAFGATRIIAERYGLEFRCAELDRRTGLVPVESILDKVDRNTTAVTVIHASNILGSKNDVVAISREVRRINPATYIILDGAQHASHGLIDVEAYSADAWIFVPYKTYSKVGAAFAWVADRLANLPHDNLLGKPKDFWDLGTREAAGYACMSAVVEYFRWLGSKFTDSTDGRARIVAAMLAIEGHEGGLLKALLHGTGRMKGMLQVEGVKVLGEKDNPADQEAIIAFTVAGADTKSVIDYFGSNGVRLHDRVNDAYSGHTLSAMGVEECTRISLCHYNTVEEVEEFLRLLAEFVDSRR